MQLLKTRPIMPHARWLALVLTTALTLVGTRASGQPDPHLSRLAYHALMGTWTCRGSDDRNAALTTTLTWGFNDGGGFYFTSDPKPKTLTHPAIAELWEWDAAGSVWRAVPDSGTAEHVHFVTGGWTGSTLLWSRMAAESTMDRAFVRTGAERLTFRSERTIFGLAGAPSHKHVFFHVACKRTENDAPR